MRNWMRRVWTVAVAASLLVSANLASAVPVARVEAVTSRQQPYPVDSILANVETKAGREFSAETLSQDIERLYKTGFFRYVDTRASDEAAGKVVVFIVDPLPQVRNILFEGNSALSDRHLRRLVKIKPGDLLEVRQVAADTKEIAQRYRTKGYYRTLVEVEEREVAGTSSIDLVWRIAEEPRHKVRQVVVVGNTAYTDRQLRRALLTRRTFWGRMFSTGYFNERKFDADQRTLRQMYEDKGHLDAQFELAEEVDAAGEWVVLTITIDEGPVYMVSQVGFSGPALFGDAELRAQIGTLPGQPYSYSVQRADVVAIQNMYRPLGYLRMSCRAVLAKDVAARTVAIDYQIFEGVPARIRDINISGNLATRDQVIRRELRLQPGDLANANQIDTSREVLQNLGFFEEVTVSPRSVGGDDSLADLDIVVKEGPTGQFTFGGGFSDSDGFVLSAEVSKSNFDLSRFLSSWPPQATGGGQRMRLSLQAGSQRNDFSLSFVEPWFLDRQLRLETSIFHRNRDYSQYLQTSTGGEAMLTRRWFGNWRQSFGLRVEHVELDDFDDFSSLEMLEEEGKYWSNSLIYGMSRDTRNAFYNATRGSRLGVRLRLAPQALGSYSDVYQIDINGTKYLALGKNSTVRLFGRIGVVDKLSGDSVAIFDRYFAGGGDSFRGFSYREISPVDINEDPVGGRSAMLGTIEFIQVFRSISEHLRGSVFCDFGNVWKDAYEFNPAEFNASLGVGLEINLPMGRGSIPIRLDYGFPVVIYDDHLSRRGRFHFNFGYRY